MNDSMTKLQHVMLAEESIAGFIEFLEARTGPVGKEDQEWLFEKGREIFDSYYVDIQVAVNLSSDEERVALDNYFNVAQSVLGHMFAHIMMLEFKLHLISKPG